MLKKVVENTPVIEWELNWKMAADGLELETSWYDLLMYTNTSAAELIYMATAVIPADTIKLYLPVQWHNIDACPAQLYNVHWLGLLYIHSIYNLASIYCIYTYII